MATLEPVFTDVELISSPGTAGSRVANSGSVDGVSDDVPRPSKGGKCPPHLLKRTADKEADTQNVATNEEVGGVKK